ncbi:MAG TPA: hypothetical protein VGC27_07415, partial [Rhizomicrobium sp.]
MALFLMSLMSSSDQWMFVSSTGLWKPRSPRHEEPYRVTRSLSRSVSGNKLIFEEVNHDLGFALTSTRMCSDRVFSAAMIKRDEFLGEGPRYRRRGAGSFNKGVSSMFKGWMLAVAAGTMMAASAQPAAMPWLDPAKPAEQRAAAAVAAMTLDEKLTLIFSYSEPDTLDKEPDDVVPAAMKAEVREKMVPASAGYLPGIPRLKIPGQWFTDASIGIHIDKGRTALPSSIATAASFDPSVAEMGGKM